MQSSTSDKVNVSKSQSQLTSSIRCPNTHVFSKSQNSTRAFIFITSTRKEWMNCTHTAVVLVFQILKCRYMLFVTSIRIEVHGISRKQLRNNQQRFWWDGICFWCNNILFFCLQNENGDLDHRCGKVKNLVHWYCSACVKFNGHYIKAGPQCEQKHENDI